MRNESITRLEEDHCPICNAKLDAASSAEVDKEDYRPPKEGDVTFCLKCAALLIFGIGMKVRFATPEEWNSFEPDDIMQFYHIQRTILKMRGERN